MARALILCLTWFILGSSAAAESLTQQYQQARTGGEWHTTSAAEQQVVALLLPDMLAGDMDADQKEQLNALGWDWLPLDNGNFLLQEQTQHRYGRGLYLFNPKAPTAVFVQIPHSFYDLGTGRIGLELARYGDIKMLGWNTVQRFSHPQSDLAHQPQSVFQALTRAFVQHLDAAHIIQLHGFSNNNRTTTAGDAASIILSSGSKDTSSTSLKNLQTCIKNSFAALPPESIRCYPDEISELGATTNAQAKLLLQLDKGNFWHIELNKSVRNLLRRDPAALLQWHKCMLPEVHP